MKKIAKKALTGNVLDDHPVLTIIVLTLMLLAALAKPCSAATNHNTHIKEAWSGYAIHSVNECWYDDCIQHTFIVEDKAKATDGHIFVSDPTTRVALVNKVYTMLPLRHGDTLCIKTSDTRNGLFHEQDFIVIKFA